MKESLLNSGYDSIDSLRIICAESIPDMEDYLKIKFLPAHKGFILDIPKQIKKMDAKENGSLKNQQCKKQKKTVSENPLPKLKQPKKIEEGTVKCKSDKRPQGLKNQLLDKIRKYVNSNDLLAGNENMTNDNVIGFKRSGANEKYLYECYFKCPVCGKTCLVKCNLAKSWDTKNFYGHLNKYHKSDKKAATSVSSSESTTYLTPVIQSVYTMHPTAAPTSI